jgi:uroporphyrinogen decarboxylase
MTMSSLERVTAALELREPDRVPTMDVMEEYSNIYEILGKKPVPLGFLVANKYASKLFDMVAPLVNRFHIIDREMDHFSHDRVDASVRMGYDSVWTMHVPIWRFDNSKTTTDIYGRYYDLVVDHRGNIGTPMYRGGLLKGPDDWDAWDKKDILRLPERANRAFSRIQKDFGNDIFIMGSFLFGLFETCWQPFGFERFAVAIRREKDFMRRYIKFYEDLYCMMIEAWADAGLPGAVYSDDMAYRSGPMLNPKTMEEFLGDPFRRITETAHKLGMKIVVHTDGNVYPLVEWFADCGFDGVHALEPTAGVELTKVKEMVGDRMCLLGNVDITHILVDATREEVFADVKQRIADAGRGGGYIVAPTNSHPGMSLQQLRWMLEAVEEYGHYPLKV